ncbi:MAG: ankyrin repeat domain-containing protein [Brevinema sp.]
MKHIVLWFTILGIVAPIYTQMEANSSNYSPLHWAAAQGYVEMIKVLADKGYNINAQDANGFTPLHYAAAAGSFQGVEFLVDRGADVYRVNKKNVTPMTLAAQAGEQKIVDFLFVKMRSMRVDQLRAQAEKERINTDLVQAAKARAEAERLRKQAADWTTEAEYWKVEAEKWTRESNLLKEQQIQLDQLAKERYDQIIQEKYAAEENFKAERLARTVAERLLREQSANATAQIRAYEAQAAALSAQRATDAAIENLAEEFIRQGMVNPQHYNMTNANNTDYIGIDTNLIPVQVLPTPPVAESNYSIQLEEVPTPVPTIPPVDMNTEEEPTEDPEETDGGYEYTYDESYVYTEE